VGSTIIIVAMVISYYFDLPTGYTIVFIGSLVGIVWGMI
jgi:zinc/manganese transport system permease protein